MTTVRTLALALTTTIAFAGLADAAGQRITPRGAGKVRIGKSYKSLRKARLVRRITPGCELGGPRTRSARLRRPLKGTVDFTTRSPRKVSNITITGGARARGVGIGDTISDIKAVYPRARVDHSTDDTFLLTLVKVSKSAGGRLQFAVDTGTGKISLIGIPFIAFCE